MATPSPAFELPLAEFAASLLAERETAPRAALIAEYVAQLFAGCAVSVYVIDDQEAQSWKPRAIVGDAAHEEQLIELSSGTLGGLAESHQPLIYSAADLSREDYAHLHLRRSFQSLAYVPLAIEELMVGAIEIISFDSPISEEQLAPVMQLAEVGAIAFATSVAYEAERQAQLESLTRLTSLYDLEVVFNSTLEMDDLMPLVTSKIQELMEVQAVNLWMIGSDDKMLLMHRTGEDPAYEIGAELEPTEGIPGAVSEAGEGILIAAEDDQRLIARNRHTDQFPAFSIIAVPLMEKGVEVGVLEAINKVDGTSFDESDLYLLQTVGEAAAGALHNASLLNAERKVEILETLVKVSTEITSTLNLERVLQAVVNGPQMIIPYERASIALEHHGRFQLKAVSGQAEVNRGDPAISRLREVLEWAMSGHEEIYINRTDGEIDDERPETRAKFTSYFDDTGYSSFYARPLQDDQGRVGIYCLESSEPDFLDEAHLEIIQVLCGQATVALRNAELYREVPLIGILEPLIKKRDKFLSMEKGRRTAHLALAAAAAIFLAVFPLPMRLDGEASVSPSQTVQVQPQVDGVIRNVYVREGDPVHAGTILADMEDWDYRANLAAAQAKYASALAAMNQSLAGNDPAAAGVQRIQAEYWSGEVERAKAQLEHTHIRSNIDGVVTTPHIENAVGKRLLQGDAFAEVADTATAQVDVAIDEREASLLQPGATTAVKLASFPTRTFRGTVNIISPRTQPETDHRIFYARVSVPNPDGAIRPGMQGRGKVDAGWHRAGYVLFRGTAMWAWQKLWSWFGW